MKAQIPLSIFKPRLSEFRKILLALDTTYDQERNYPTNYKRLINGGISSDYEEHHDKVESMGQMIKSLDESRDVILQQKGHIAENVIAFIEKHDPSNQILIGTARRFLPTPPDTRTAWASGITMFVWLAALFTLVIVKFGGF